MVGRKEKLAAVTKNTGQERCGKNMQEKYETRTGREQKSRVQEAREEKFGKKINSTSAKMVIFFPPQSVTTLVFNYFCVYVIYFFVLRWGELLRLILLFL